MGGIGRAGHRARISLEEATSELEEPIPPASNSKDGSFIFAQPTGLPPFRKLPPTIVNTPRIVRVLKRMKGQSSRTTGNPVNE